MASESSDEMARGQFAFPVPERLPVRKFDVVEDINKIPFYTPLHEDPVLAIVPHLLALLYFRASFPFAMYGLRKLIPAVYAASGFWQSPRAKRDPTARHQARAGVGSGVRAGPVCTGLCRSEDKT
jgi:hypothetical protein